MSEERDLAVPEPMALAIPMMEIEELKKLTAYVNEVKKTLMIKGKDYVIDGNRQYTARSGFAKLHQGFFLSDEKPEIKTLYYDEPREFEYTHRIRRELKEEKITTKIYGFEAYVTVINVNTGRHASGEGACTLEELHQTHNMSPKWYHRCLGTAKTRAWNRAVSNYVGSAEVSAEEMGLKYTDDEPGPRAREKPKEVDSQKRDIYPLPSMPLDTPSWDFAVMVRDKGWEEVDGIVVAYLFDMGFENPESAFEYGHDIAKAWIKNAPGVYFGDGMKEVDTVLQIAGFKYHGGEKRWRFAKPEKPSEPEEKPVEEPEPTPTGESEEGNGKTIRQTYASPGNEEALAPESSEETPPQEKESPQGSPRSVKDVREKLEASLPGHKDLVTVSEYDDYYRIGRKVTLDTEIENHLDFLVTEMGGEFDKEKNAWVIPKEAEG